ncbi:glycoside hydrolase family 97 protein [Fulvivirga sp. M361]|uniref:glycoside hydrolase family 97 protein n=1 Tax=Fulvivirga sp. M361 TaxID=2594266 RepID=UPI00117A2468|nr:glycoside hydrolase family 97 protein [Fulvivirga sp. M361]TRX60157.1 glycoside hydrolase family 97 protein [Fulvivirga sp. M361]
MNIVINKSLIFTLLIALLTMSCKKEIKEVRVASPDQSIRFALSLNTDGVPFYSVNKSGGELLSPSALGFDLKGTEDLKSGFFIQSMEESTFDETWNTAWGQFSSYRNHYNEVKITLKERSGTERALIITARVFDDGIGFRYEFPEQPNLDSVLILDELTEFQFTGDHKAWYTKADFDTYELKYNSTLLSEMESANTPFTLKTAEGVYISLHEANLTDYAGMSVKAKEGSPLTYEADLAPWPDGIKVKNKTPFKTPWRTLQITDNPADLITSGLLLNLNEPNKLDDVSWITPMKYVGIWWSLHQGVETWTMGPEHGATTENMKKHIDFAAKHNIKGVMAEGWNQGWENWGKANVFDFITPYADYDLKEVVAYANEKGVSLISHHETGGNVTSYESNLQKAFDQLEKFGIHALKTGYAGPIQPEGHVHHNQYMVRHYRRVLEVAAQHKVMINAHEPIKPTGIERTMPNMMTREGAQGMEWNGWSHDITPEHTLILPFTRILAGPMDYTPGIFDLKYESYDDKRRKWHPSRGDITDMRVKTTLAKQLALMVILYSPMQMAADMIDIYEAHPAFQFIEDLEVDYDHTLVLEAEIGQHLVIARRTRENWYIGGATGKHSKQLQIELDFLEKGKRYSARIYEDAPETDLDNNPGAYQILETEVDRTSVIHAILMESGGIAISLEPVK